MEVYTPYFHPAMRQPWVLRPGAGLSPRRIFQVCKRLRPWWRCGELYIYRLAGVPHSPSVAPVRLGELLPWGQFYFPHGPLTQHCLLPRADVELYRLGVSQEAARHGFFILFDWCSGKDVLLKQARGVWPGRGSLRIIEEAEWREAELLTSIVTL